MPPELVVAARAAKARVWQLRAEVALGYGPADLAAHHFDSTTGGRPWGFSPSVLVQNYQKAAEFAAEDPEQVLPAYERWPVCQPDSTVMGHCPCTIGSQHCQRTSTSAYYEE